MGQCKWTIRHSFAMLQGEYFYPEELIMPNYPGETLISRCCVYGLYHQVNVHVQNTEMSACISNGNKSKRVVRSDRQMR